MANINLYGDELISVEEEDKEEEEEEEEEETEKNVAAILTSVFVPLFLIIIILVVYCFLKKKKTHDKPQSEEEAVDDAEYDYQHDQLESGLLFNDSAKGLRKEDIPVNTVLAQCGKILETSFKLFNVNFTEDKGLPPESCNELFLCMCYPCAYTKTSSVH